MSKCRGMEKMMALSFNGSHLVKMKKLRQIIEAQEISHKSMMMNGPNTLQSDLEEMTTTNNKPIRTVQGKQVLRRKYKSFSWERKTD